MRVKRNEEKSYIKLDLKELYMYFCFIFMFLVLLEWFYNFSRQIQPIRPHHGTASPPGRQDHFLASREVAQNFPRKGGGFCSVPGSQHLHMNENQRKQIFKYFL